MIFITEDPDLANGLANVRVVAAVQDLPDDPGNAKLVLVDHRLPPSRWRDEVVGLLRALPDDVEVLLYAPAGTPGDLMTAVELLRFGIQVIDDVELLGTDESAEGDHEIPDSPGDRGSEFRTLLATEGAQHTMNSLVEARNAMRRRTPRPIWDHSATTGSLKAPISGILDYPDWEQGPPSRPALRDLLKEENLELAQAYLRYMDLSTKDATEVAKFLSAYEWDSRQVQYSVPPCLLITGETGTGKTAMAKIVHGALFEDEAPSNHRPFITVSGPSIRSEMWNDQFYGHTDKGYTSVGALVGHATRAAFGTLFIDEIGDLDATAQVNLLTFLTERWATIAGLTPENVFLPVQVIAATNRPLELMVRTGRFRPDLLNRFRFQIEIPPLRERIQGNRPELVGLVEAFLADRANNPILTRGPRQGERTVTHYTDDVLDDLEKRKYLTGNIRELIDIIALGVVNAGRRRSAVLTQDHLPENRTVTELVGASIPVNQTLRDLELIHGRAMEIDPERLLGVAFGSSQPTIQTTDGHLALIDGKLLWSSSTSAE